MKYSRVCIVDTVYSLFLYLIYYNNHIDDTFFIFSDGINPSIRQKFAGRYFYARNFYSHSIYKKLSAKVFVSFLLYILVSFYFQIRFFFLRKLYIKSDAMVFGHDHLFYSKYFLGKQIKFTLLEDGVGNYKEIYVDLEKYNAVQNTKGVKYYTSRIRFPFPKWGVSDFVDQIVLTGLMSIPSIIESKVVLIDIQFLFGKLSESKKAKIYDIFSVSCLDNMEIDLLILTQCFSEDGFMSEDKKIELYGNIVSEYSHMNIFIKPHPRELTDYKTIFPGVKIIKNTIPIEFLALSATRVNTVITITSSGAYIFKGKCKVIFKNDFAFNQ